jgi:hypothetical protein
VTPADVYSVTPELIVIGAGNPGASNVKLNEPVAMMV